MDRDGRQGWSRRAEAGWDRCFGTQRARQLAAMSPNVVRLYCSPGEIVSDGRQQWRVSNNYTLEEISDGQVQA